MSQQMSFNNKELLRASLEWINLQSLVS